MPPGDERSRALTATAHRTRSTDLHHDSHRPALARTRRHFFRDCGVGVGAMALASLLARDATPPRPTASDPLAPEEAALRRRRRRRSSSCSWPAGRASSSCSTPKPKLQQARRPAGARVVHRGQAVRVHQGRRQAARHRPQVREGRQVRHGPQRAAAAPPRDRRRRVLAPRDGDGRVQPRPGEVLRQHRQAAVRPAEHGRVGHLRHRQRVRQPAGLRRAAVRPARPARRGGALRATGFLPSVYQGVPFLKGPNPILDLAAAAGRRRRSSRASSSTR